MSNDVKTPTHDELWAFVQGDLSPLRTIEISALLTADLSIGKTVKEMTAHNRILECADASVLDERVPEHLIELVRQHAKDSQQEN